MCFFTVFKSINGNFSAKGGEEVEELRKDKLKDTTTIMYDIKQGRFVSLIDVNSMLNCYTLNIFLNILFSGHVRVVCSSTLWLGYADRGVRCSSAIMYLLFSLFFCGEKINTRKTHPL